MDVRILAQYVTTTSVLIINPRLERFQCYDYLKTVIGFCKLCFCCSRSYISSARTLQCRAQLSAMQLSLCLLSTIKYFKLFPFTLIISHPQLSKTPFMRNKTKFEWKYRRQWHHVTQGFKSWHQNLQDVKIAKRSLIPVPAHLFFFPTFFV